MKVLNDSHIGVSTLTRLTIHQQQFGELELQAIYGSVVRTGVEKDRLVGVVTLGDRLFFYAHVFKIGDVAILVPRGYANAVENTSRGSNTFTDGAIA
ncbi:MAG TPA: hypothetical protein V6D11_09010 [Waterburya sp.]|jgi:hypothetical protein